jgi:hypothetical protein
LFVIFFANHKNSIFVQAAVEANVVEGGGGGADKGNLNLGLVLQEVRRRADSDTLARHTQDIFKAVHNVQKRLLEEHVSTRLYFPLQRMEPERWRK